jgi:hypothetical protein
MMERGNESWRDAPNTNGAYSVSNLGRVARVLTRGNRPCFKIVKPVHGSIAYPTVHLSLGGKRKRVTIHRLVALAFIPNPANLPQVNHKDENPRNNRADNLEWCTELYNHNYGTYREKQVLAHANPIMFRRVRYNSIKDCARRTGHMPATVKRHCERISA